MTEAQEQTEAQETQAQEQTEAPPEEGRAPVDFESPETEARFKRVYYYMKQNERVGEQLAAQNAKLIARIEKMERDQEERSSSDQLTKLKEAEKAALEEGDFERASTVRDEITDLKVDSKVPKPKEAEPEPWLTPEREQQIAEWAGQRDDKGGLLRPWADPEHEAHATMMRLADALVREDPDMELTEFLDGLEAEAKKLTPKPARSAPSVLGVESDARPVNKKTLSEDEKLIVRRMYPGVPPKEAEQRYLKAKENYL